MTLSRRTLRRTAIPIGYAVVVALVIVDLFTNVFAKTWPDRAVVGWLLFLTGCGLLWLADWTLKIWKN
jgi:protein-S-isoprenylcysteine O-methyltransferase Ste14